MSQHIQILLASNSKFFLEGIRKILENEGSINIAAEALDREEIEKYLISMKPKLLLLDNRTLNLDIHELLNLTSKNGLDIKVILLGNKTEDNLDSPNILHIPKETNSLELIKTIKETQNKKIQLDIENDIPEALPILYVPDVIELTEAVLSRNNGKRKPLEKEIRSSEKELLPLQKELEKSTVSHSPYVDASRRKINLKKETIRLGREIAFYREKIEEKRKLLSLPYRQFNHPEAWKEKHLPFFLRVSGKAVMLLLLIGGFTYIGSAYLTGRSTFSGFMEEIIFPPTDSSIKSDIETSLWKQGYTDIKVSVIGGKAVLNGKVSTEDNRITIQNTAKSIWGVKGVENDIVVEKIISDAEISSGIRKDLDDKGYSNIGVTVNNRRAILSGTLSRKEERKAIQDIAMNVEGVEAVEDNLKIVPKKAKQAVAKKRNTIKKERPAYQYSLSSIQKVETKSEWRIRK